MSALNFVIHQQLKHDGGNDGRISAQKFVVFLTKRKLAAHSEAKKPFQCCSYQAVKYTQESFGKSWNASISKAKHLCCRVEVGHVVIFQFAMCCAKTYKWLSGCMC